MQTAVETIIAKIKAVKPTQFCSIETILEWCEQAKEMEKQQIIDAWIATDNELQRIAAEQYYISTYGSKGSDEHIVDTNEMISSQTEISDEEIEKRIKEVGAMGEYYKWGYRDAIIWYREQLKSRQ